MSLRHDEGWNVPPDAPFYPTLPAIYRNVKSQFVFFRAQPAAVARFLPEPLLPASDGVCVAAGMEVPFCTSYGAFREAFLILKCQFHGKEGYYSSHVFHNGPAGIAAGREIYGTPKRFARMSVKRDGRLMITEAFVGGCSVLRVSSVVERIGQIESMPVLAPAWRLKIIPRADGPGPLVKQLIDCSHTTRDLVVHWFAHAKGTIALGASPELDLQSLAPTSCDDAFYLESSYSEHYGEVVYDYLQNRQNSPP